MRTLLAAALLALAAGGPARAQSAAPDSAHRRTAPAPEPWHEQPRFVMLRSLLVPGWGQYHNGAWYKALAVAGGEVWLGTRIVKDKNELDDLLAEVEEAQSAGDPARYEEAVNSYNDRLDTYVRHQWLFGGLLAYALIDAYVDAHFHRFDIEFQTDPALPGDPPEEPDAPKSGGPARRGGTRLSLRWHF